MTNAHEAAKAMREVAEAALDKFRVIKTFLSYANQDVVSAAVAQSNKNLAWHEAVKGIENLEYALFLPLPEAPPAPETDEALREAVENAICGAADCFLSDAKESADAALAVARPIIARQARDAALDEAAEICRGTSSTMLALHEILDLKDKPDA